MERKERERLELQRQKEEAAEKGKPYLLTFYKQVFNLDELPAEKAPDYRCDFNFLGDYIYPHIDMDREYSSKKFEFDFENEPMLAMINRYGKGNIDTLYLYCLKDKYWNGVDLPDLEHHKMFKFNNNFYLLSANDYNDELVEVVIHIFSPYPHSNLLLHYKTKTPSYYYDDTDSLMANDIKIGKKRRYYYRDDDESKTAPNGLVTCDFYDGDELFTVKILRNHGDSVFIRVLDSQKNVLSEICRRY